MKLGQLAFTFEAVVFALSDAYDVPLRVERDMSAVAEVEADEADASPPVLRRRPMARQVAKTATTEETATTPTPTDTVPRPARQLAPLCP